MRDPNDERSMRIEYAMSLLKTFACTFFRSVYILVQF